MDEILALQGITFVWNRKKALENRLLHRISFETACEAFFDPFLRIVDASRNSEQREGLIGMDQLGRLLFVVSMELEGEVIRIISARRATTEERMYYEDI